MQLPQSPPANWSWTGNSNTTAAAATSNSGAPVGAPLGSPKQMNTVPQEIGTDNELVELDAGDHGPVVVIDEPGATHNNAANTQNPNPRDSTN